MELTESFVNWGFNPKTKGTGLPYALVWGGGSPDDYDSYCGLMLCSSLKEGLKAFWNMWPDNNEDKWDEAYEYIQEDGGFLQMTDINGVIPTLYLSSHAKNYGYGADDEKYRLAPNRIPLIGLTETMEYSEANYGQLEGDPDWASYRSDCRTYYYDYIDGLDLTQYEKNLEKMKELWKERTKTKWHNNIIITETTYRSDWNVSTQKLVYLLPQR